MTDVSAPLYPAAILLPILSFPSWMLCILPLSWHFRQGNIAAGSLILWVVMMNFFNSINPLIWPCDNIEEWWDGHVWCDIHARLQVGCIVGTTASTAMIVRKLAKVMDTRNITVSSSRDNKVKEKVLEILWCWIYPLVLILLYYVVQPVRYMIYGVIGCLSAYDTSWPSLVLSFMWAPITIIVAAGYAVLLSYRLYRYRREFVRLVAARNTTKSRFLRLFIICIIVVLAYVPYTIWLLVTLSSAIVNPYSWSRVHDSERFNSILKVPSYGVVTIDKWGQVATGYVLFLLFGTGSDAYSTYKKMLVAVGLGKIFPGLYNLRESEVSTPSSFINARTWTNSISSKAKSMFWSRSDSVTSTFQGSTRNDSIAMASMQRFGSATPSEPIVTQSSQPSFFARIFGRWGQRYPVLPLFSLRRSRDVKEIIDTDTQRSTARDQSPGVSARAWAADKPGSSYIRESDGVCVFREIHLECQELDGAAKERKSDNDWA